MNIFSRIFRRKATMTAVPAQVSSQSTDLQWVGGRLILKADPYMLPKDLLESNRLDFQHFMLKYALGGRNFLAPVQNPQAILDVGCGTGRWATEMAHAYPQSNVIGVDLIAPQSDQQAPELRPANYVFTEGNVIKGLAFADQSFDFVHMRLLYSAIPATAWPGVVSELVRVTRPGGWVEMVEAGSVEHRGPAVDAMNTWVVEACQRRGLDMTAGKRIGDMLQQAGITEVQFHELALPVGNYGGRLGTMLETDIVAILKAVKPLVVGQEIATSTDFDNLLVAWQEEVGQRQMLFPFYLAFGQRRYN